MIRRKVLVVAAHADDETLGCGGTLALHCKSGDDVAVLFLTDGVGARISADSEAESERVDATEKALSIVGVNHYLRMSFPDNAIDTVSQLQVTQAIERFCEGWGMPDIVYTHDAFDLNIDHVIAHRATMTCFRPQPNALGKPSEILCFEVMSSSGWNAATQSFQPDYFVDISETLELKLQALRAYEIEMREWPHARSLEAVTHLAKFRGSLIGSDAAEAFRVARIIRS